VNDARTPDTVADGDVAAYVRDVGEAARAASREIARASTHAKNLALERSAAALRRDVAAIVAANAQDVASARAAGHDAAFVDRLTLGERAVEAMAQGLAEIAALPDPVGEITDLRYRPSGIQVGMMRVPLGVIAIVYESRPNVTADAAALCLKSGNATILRGGSEAIRSNRAIARCIGAGLGEAGLPAQAVQLIDTTDRAAVGYLIADEAHVDVIVPRGGKSLIARVQRESRVPVLAHLEGLCHVYVDAAADSAKARAIVLNAKMRRTSVCGAAETLLVDRAGAARLLPPILADLRQAGCALRGDEATRALDPAVAPANEADWTTEYLDAILAVRIVDGVDGAIAHINRYGSHHTDAIVSENAATAERFAAEIDSAIVLVNASTQFADGGEFGMGAEIGISTGRLHARGPVGAEQLTTYKYVVRGDGQVRP